MTARSRALAAASVVGLGCMPELDARSFEVDRGRVLAVAAEPAEARPGARVSYDILAVGPQGRETDARLRWTYCVTPKPSTTRGAVSDECRLEAGVQLEASASRAAGELPADACARFGPDPPPGPARPRDPDITGGFYQPLRIDAFGSTWIHLQRIQCNPRNAPADVARQHAERYVPNQNPHIEALRLESDGTPLTTATVAPHQTIDVVLEWLPEDVESYVWIEPSRSTLEPRREALSASWFATAGTFALDRTGVSEGELATSSSNRWTAPDEPGPASLWVVLRDSRGGAAFEEVTVQVE